MLQKNRRKYRPTFFLFQYSYHVRKKADKIGTSKKVNLENKKITETEFIFQKQL